MDSIRRGFARLLAVVRRRRKDDDFDEELAAHLQMAIDDHLARGMSPQEARRLALLKIGGVAQTRELHRDTRGLPFVETVLQDLRYCVRTLRRDAAFATFAILIVGFGVGASSTVFNIFNALVLRPLPFHAPSRLVWIANGESANLSAQTVQVFNLTDLKAQSESFSGIAAFSPFYGPGDIRLTGVGEPERLTGVPVTGDFFPLLGVQPQIGSSSRQTKSNRARRRPHCSAMDSGSGPSRPTPQSPDARLCSTARRSR